MFESGFEKKVMALFSTGNNTGSDPPAEICPMCCETIVEATEDTEGQEALFFFARTPASGYIIVDVLEYTRRATRPCR